MREMVHGRKSPTRQRCDGQLHQPPNHQTIGDPDGTPKTTDPTHHEAGRIKQYCEMTIQSGHQRHTTHFYETSLGED